MNKFIIFITILILFLSPASADSFTCRKLFKEEYELFVFVSRVPNPIEIEKSFKIDKQTNSLIDGKLLTSVCGDVTIPENCPNAGEKAKLVFQPSSNQNECLVVRNNDDWNYVLEKDEYHQKIIITGQDEDSKLKLAYNFNCEIANTKATYDVFFNEESSTFNVNIGSLDGCGIQLDVFKALSRNPMITAVVFSVLGFILCFLGLKFYKDFLSIFIPILILILGFYLYMTFIEKSNYNNDKIILVVAMLFCIVGIVVLTVMFSSMIYLVLSFLVSYELGVIIDNYLEKKFEFFAQEYSEFAIIPVIFIVFFLFYLTIKDYFIIFSTALLGSCFLIISLPYYGFSEFDFLFDLQLDKFNDLKNLDPNYTNFVVIYVLFALIGALIQIVMFKKKPKSHRNEDVRIDLQMKL